MSAVNRNKAELLGYLGKKPENKSSGSGRNFTVFSVATSDKWKDSNGQQKERTEWHDVVAFGKLGEICEKYLHKGSRVLVVGQLRYRTWEKDGVSHRTCSIVANEVLFLSQNPKPEEAAQATPPAPEDDLSF